MFEKSFIEYDDNYFNNDYAHHHHHHLYRDGVKKM